MQYRLQMPPLVIFSFLLARLVLRGNKKPDERVILVIRGDGIGDFVLTTPFLRELRRYHKEFRIVLCVRKSVFDLARRCPYVDHVICLPSDISAQKQGLRKYLAIMQFAKKELRTLKPGITINPRLDYDQDWITLLQLFSGAPVRFGYTRKATRKKAAYDFGFDALLTHILPALPSVTHESERGLAIIRALGFSPCATHAELWANHEDEKEVHHLMSTMEMESKRIYAVSPSVFSGRRLWPIERYQKIIETLAKKGMKCLLLGADKEATVLQQIADNPNCNALNFAGKLSLTHIYVLLKHCALLMGADSGLAHIAAIVCPTIVLSPHPECGNPSSENSPERFKPIGMNVFFIQPQNALPPCSDSCQYNMQHCIRNVKEEQVMKVVNDILRLHCSLE